MHSLLSSRLLAASSGRQRPRVLAGVKAASLRSAHALRAEGLDAGSAHARRELALDDDARSYAASRLAPFRATDEHVVLDQGDGPEPEHRAARLAEDLRPAARRLQPRARLEPAGRPGAGEGAAAGPSRLHRGDEAADRS